MALEEIYQRRRRAPSRQYAEGVGWFSRPQNRVKARQEEEEEEDEIGMCERPPTSSGRRTGDATRSTLATLAALATLANLAIRAAKPASRRDVARRKSGGATLLSRRSSRLRVDDRWPDDLHYMF